MKMTIALYSLYGSGEIPKEVTDYKENDPDYVRLTEPQEITFIEREHADVVLEKVDGLKIRREELRAEMGAKIALVDDQIQKLMAIEQSTTDEA